MNNYKIEDIDLSEDISAFDDHLLKNEMLYDEVHDVFKRTSGGGAGVMGMGQTRDLAEMGKTLSSIRSTGIQGVNQRFAAKKSVIELRMKKAAMDKGTDFEENIDVARALLRTIQVERVEQRRNGGSDQPSNDVSARDDSVGKAKLRERVQSKLDTGVITITPNERAMKYDYQDRVAYAFDNTTSKVVAIVKAASKPIQDYPTERIPKIRIVKKDGNTATTSTGEELPVITTTKKAK